MQTFARVVFGLIIGTCLAFTQAGCGGADSQTLSAVGVAAADDAPAGEQTTEEAAEHPANRLGSEASPYLKLHAHNPVDWYPWGPEALQKAVDENKPIFLSIGYSSCFWCHVMEREVFENADIAAYMNEHFVNIKVDREERPDLDDIYMLALQVYLQAVGSPEGGGWPLSIFLTPDGYPIAGGTYFPPEDKQGRAGFPNVLRTVHTIWTEQEETVRESSEILAGEVRRLSRPPLTLEPVPLHADLIVQATSAVMQQYDPEYGGLDFSPLQPETPKFPVPSRLNLLQSRLRDGHDEEIAAALDHSLEAMANGGIYDHLGGGFHRYSTDRRWLIPHFEKMLYDNAQLVAVYSDAYSRTNNDLYRQVVEESVGFVLRELRDPAGGFYSALDAETDGIEGAHYVWTREEIDFLLGALTAPTFAAAYGLEADQTFEHGLILHRPRSFTETARELGVPLATLEQQLADSRASLLEVRQQRPALLKDDKVIVAWNGLMISALARSGSILSRQEHITAGEEAALFLLSRLRDAEGRLLHNYCQERAYLPAYLDDYAYLVQALLDLHLATGEEEWLTAARHLTDDQVSLFWDTAGGGFFYTGSDHEVLLARTKEAYDSVMPSGNSVSALNLVRLARLTEESSYQELARDTLKAFTPQLARSPGSMPAMANSLAEYIATFGEEAAPAAIANAPNDAPAATNQPAAGNNEEPTPFATSESNLMSSMPQYVATAVYLDRDLLIPGEAARVAIVIDVVDTWHINANPPRPEFVKPTEWLVPEGSMFALDNVAYPEGEDLMIEGFDQPVEVYEGQVVLIGEITPSVDLTAGGTELALELRYQACNDRECTRPLKLTLSGNVVIGDGSVSPTAINQAIFAMEEEVEDENGGN
jgi:uncharacterized protein YyaL (SSP411 family)